MRPTVGWKISWHRPGRCAVHHTLYEFDAADRGCAWHRTETKQSNGPTPTHRYLLPVRAFHVIYHEGLGLRPQYHSLAHLAARLRARRIFRDEADGLERIVGESLVVVEPQHGGT